MFNQTKIRFAYCIVNFIKVGMGKSIISNLFLVYFEPFPSFQVANGCGIPNMYMVGYRCRVTGTTGDRPVAPAVPPVWCEEEPDKCVKGAKQVRRAQ